MDDFEHINTRLFETWPKNQLRPEGNPAYEGTGYPAAGYGQRRNVLVPVASSSRITVLGTAATHGGEVSPREIAVLAGLSADVTVNAVMLRDNQAQAVLREVTSIIQKMQEQVDNPPYFTLDSVLSSWKTAVRTARDVEARLIASKTSALSSDLTFTKWLDMAALIPPLAATVEQQLATSGLWNALKYTLLETSGQVVEGTQEAGQRIITTGDALTKPWVLGGLAVGALAVYLFARSGGSVVRIHMDRPEAAQGAVTGDAARAPRTV
jgi:hypothetical protein